MPLHIELIEPEQGHFTVIVGGRFADHLCRDEALGIVAAALFGGQQGPLPYLRTYEQWDYWDREYRRKGAAFVPAALLTWRGKEVGHDLH